MRLYTAIWFQEGIALSSRLSHLSVEACKQEIVEELREGFPDDDLRIGEWTRSSEILEQEIEAPMEGLFLVLDYYLDGEIYHIGILETETPEPRTVGEWREELPEFLTKRQAE